MPWQTEDSTLEHHFSQFGSVEEAQIMRERYTGKSRGFGFVTFSSAGDARGAVASEHLIEGRRCEAKFALPEGKVGSARTTRIFVARIPSSVSDLQFRGYFEQVRPRRVLAIAAPALSRCRPFLTLPRAPQRRRAAPRLQFGTVQDAYMPKDPSKQGHRGIGFVTYAAADSVERVMAGAHVLNGNEIAIDRATPKSTPKDRPGVMLPGRLSMSQPNLPLLAGGGPALGGAGFHGFMHGPGGGGMPVPGRGYDEGGVYGGGGGLGSRRMSHPALSTGAQLGSPPPQGGMGPRVPSGPMPLSGLAGYGSSGAGLNLLAQAQALQHHLSSNSLSSLDGNASSQQLINLINANVAAAAAAAAGGGPHGGGGGGYHHPGMPPSASSGHLHGSAHSSSADLAGLLAQQDHMAAAAAAAGGGHGGWGGPVRGAGGPPLGHPGAQGGAGPFGPASARAGPRIFVGKLNRETSEQDVKDYFSRFGYVLDVYLPRGEVLWAIALA